MATKVLPEGDGPVGEGEEEEEGGEEVQGGSESRGVAGVGGQMDPFFEGDDNVLKSYSFDYDTIIKFEQAMKRQAICELCLTGCGIPCAMYDLGAYHMFGKENVEEQVNAKHLAISRDGIRYVVDRHMTGCRCLRDQVQGKVSKTVPYDKITDCDIEEPAGYHMICGFFYRIENVLYRVQVDTASGAGKSETGHELSIAGLEDPEQFKKDVWAMKRGEKIAGVESTVAPLAVSMSRDGDGGSSEAAASAPGGAGLADVLRELVDVSKQQLACLIEMKEHGYSPVDKAIDVV